MTSQEIKYVKSRINYYLLRVLKKKKKKIWKPLQNFRRQKDDMRNNDQTELGTTGQNLFVRDFCAPRVLADMKKMPLYKEKRVSVDTHTRATTDVFDIQRTVHRDIFL